MIVTNGKIYDTCRDCGSLVRINKPLLGSLHICRTEDEIAAQHAIDAQLQSIREAASSRGLLAR